MAFMKAEAAGALENEDIEASASATDAQCTITSQVPLSPGADSREIKPGCKATSFRSTA